jgi:hypothetical protein
MKGYCSTGQSPQRAVVPAEKKKKKSSITLPNHSNWIFKNSTEEVAQEMR